MTLLDLIIYFRQGGTFDQFSEEHSLNPESQVIEIFAQGPIDSKSQLKFLPIEETKGQIEVLSNDIKYQNLFDLFYFLGVIDEAKSNHKLSNLDLAEKLISYAKNDA